AAGERAGDRIRGHVVGERALVGGGDTIASSQLGLHRRLLTREAGAPRACRRARRVSSAVAAAAPASRRPPRASAPAAPGPRPASRTPPALRAARRPRPAPRR